MYFQNITFTKTIFENGNGILLSELRDMLNQNKKKVYNNSETKLFITEFFGDSIQIYYSDQKKLVSACIIFKNRYSRYH